ncbi:MAG: Ldh family oxidoreductase [Chloroflexi bacterium]|nr:Ldh family oxidoreductase [Chloroflexota bacterium]
MSENSTLIEAQSLEQFLTTLFTKAGMNTEDAAFQAYALVQTDLWGIGSHGVLRAPLYLQRVRSGAINAQPHIHKVRGGLALEVWDGDDGAGFIVARHTMQRAIALAEQYGIGAVGTIRSNHFGAAGLYARMAATRGMIGIVMTNVVPNVVAPGGSKPITGNNPIAFAIPTFGEFPLVLDISLSNVAGGKLLLASKKGEKIPLDWATDDQGRPTDDPDSAFKGFLLPLGGHKGLGLSYVVDILSGLITGGVFQHGMKGMYKYPNDPSLTGHFMIVINPAAIMSPEEMQARMAEFCATIKASPMWDTQSAMLLPGEIEYRTEQRLRASGIPLPLKLVDELNQLAEVLGAAARITASS